MCSGAGPLERAPPPERRRRRKGAGALDGGDVVPGAAVPGSVGVSGVAGSGVAGVAGAVAGRTGEASVEGEGGAERLAGSSGAVAA